MFHPDPKASRLLGTGCLLTLNEQAQKMMKQMGPMMGLPGRRKATKSPKNKRKGRSSGGRPRLPAGGGYPGALPGGAPALPPGFDPAALDPKAFDPAALDPNAFDPT